MYPSSNNNGCKPPKPSFFGNYYDDTNHSRTPQEHYYPPSSFSSFLLPSPNYIPLEDGVVFCDSFQQQQYFSNDQNHHDTIILAHEMTTNVDSIMGECGSNNGQVARNDGDDEPYDFSTHMEPENSSPRRSHSKGDRHSKIDTARGPRDRRMRLSLDVAKKLFGLQDLLGFDKASKTVDWLLTKSRTAILELLPDRSCSFMGVSNSASSTSECEVLSGTADQSVLKSTTDDQTPTNDKAKSTSGGIKKKKEKSPRSGVRRSADLHHPLAKATRERARARARERTIEKRNTKLASVIRDSKCRPCLDQEMDQEDHVNQLGSWNVFDENQCQSTDQMSSNFQFKQGFVGDYNSSVMMTGNWSPNYLFNYQHIAGLTHEHHFNDFQVIGKSWEGNNT